MFVCARAAGSHICMEIIMKQKRGLLIARHLLLVHHITANSIVLKLQIWYFVLLPWLRLFLICC